MVDATDSKSVVRTGRVGSSPSSGTTFRIAWDLVADHLPSPDADLRLDHPTAVEQAPRLRHFAAGLTVCVLLLPVGGSAALAQDLLLTFGDSITAGYGDPGVDCEDLPATAGGYPVHLIEALADSGRDLTLFNRGKCGEITADGVSRMDEVLSEGLDGDDRVMILMEGTNDISAGSPPISVETIATNIQLMAEKASDAGWTPVYASIIPYGPPVNGQSRNARADLLAQILEKRAGEDDRAFADPFHDLIDLPGLYDDYYTADGFHVNGAGYELLADSFFAPTVEALDSVCIPEEPCIEEGPTLCLQAGRFQVDVGWRTANEEGVGFGEPVTADTGKFWFFGPSNLELLVKVLDARCIDGAYWVFYGALTNQEFTLTVTDNTTCARRTYFNAEGEMASIGDTDAFPILPSELPEACKPEPPGPIDPIPPDDP